MWTSQNGQGLDLQKQYHLLVHTVACIVYPIVQQLLADTDRILHACTSVGEVNDVSYYIPQ